MQERFLEVFKARNLKECLERFLPIAVEATGAEGGSILVVSGERLAVKWGKIPPEALSILESWEKRIAERLREGAWSFSWKESLPIAEMALPNNAGRLYNLPIISGTQVAGALSLTGGYNYKLSPEAKRNLSSLLLPFSLVLPLYLKLDSALRRVEHLELFFQMSQHLVSTFDLNKLLLDTMEITSFVLDVMAASLLLIKEGTDELVLEVVYGQGGEAVRRVKGKIGEGLVGWVAQNGKPIIVNNVQSDPRFNPKVDARTGILAHSIICVPLQIKGKTIGVLEAINKRSDNGFDEEDLKILSTIAAHAAIAIENAKLHLSLKEERDKLLRVQEEIRQSLARNLHDSTLQYLSAISMGLEHLSRLLEVKPEAVKAEIDALTKMTKQAIKEARLLLFELRPLVLESQGLIPALRAYVEQLNSTEHFFTHLEVEGVNRPLKRSVERNIFSIVQEAINNVEKHAKAKNVWIKVTADGDYLSVSVVDDGVGFNVKEVLSRYEERGSLGLLNMQERAKAIGAQLSIRSNPQGPGRGTIVSLRIPLSLAVESGEEKNK
ncbi:MAG: GAF domain-containing sensor histidine kinase [Anaerolineae bacterium]|nr:GAF domain-containing sensor histidine kinase [Anaerolineae bacterium]MDW8102932.1 GAF domain-containing sensor histidine kinase [Anaerolineae bacterium]